MSPTVTLPTWTLLLSGALVISSLVALMIRRLIRTRMDRQVSQQTPDTLTMAPPSGFSADIHHHILIQQIDNVFNALSAVIETERFKLKALIDHGPVPEMRPSPEMHSTRQCKNDSPETKYSEDGRVASDIVSLANEGMAPEEIARRLAISFNEVMLAIKMNASTGNKGRARLEAVA